jgi:soluble lytic murein transglycosylase
MELLVIGGILIFFIFMNQSGGAIGGSSANVINSRDIAGTIQNNYGNTVVEQAAAWNLPTERVFAIIYQESKGNPNAIGLSGERGLMQLEWNSVDYVNMKSGSSYVFDDMWDPTNNIAVGCAYLALLMKNYGWDLDTATRAYNAGPGTIQKNLEADPAYLANVQSHETLFS